MFECLAFGVNIFDGFDIIGGSNDSYGIAVVDNMFQLIFPEHGIGGDGDSADFLAAVQILVYVGAISVLIILAIMMTREVQQGSPNSRFQIPAFIVAILFLEVLVLTLINTPWPISGIAPTAPTTAALANSLFGESGYLLPVEIAAVLLLSATLGAIVLAREK